MNSSITAKNMFCETAVTLTFELQTLISSSLSSSGAFFKRIGWMNGQHKNIMPWDAAITRVEA